LISAGRDTMAAVADDDRGHALCQRADASPVDQRRDVAVLMVINKSG
jgi:hypothetical protein